MPTKSFNPAEISWYGDISRLPLLNENVRATKNLARLKKVKNENERHSQNHGKCLDLCCNSLKSEGKKQL